MGQIVDDKSQYCIPFILERLRLHRARYAKAENAPPFLLGLNGVQGAGKTVLVSIIKRTLENSPYNLPAIAISLDDFYLSRTAQLNLASQHEDNPLLQHRGQPSTHDIPLMRSVLSSLRQNLPTAIPQYDKAAFKGQGDRVAKDQWEQVNVKRERITKLVMLEGWCVGFRPFSDEDLLHKWKQGAAAAAAAAPTGETGLGYIGRLGRNTLESVTTINTALREYDQITDQLDAFIHLDALDPQYVYTWRLEQEHSLQACKEGAGMTDEQVIRFVDGYYPAYELFTDTLRAGVFQQEGGRQLRLTLGLDRTVKDVYTI